MFKTNALDSVGNAYVDEVGVTPGTRLEADDRNIIQEELVNAVEGSGQTLDASGVFTNNDQIFKAMQALGPTNRNAIINGIGEINQRVTAFTLVKDEYSFDNPGHGPDRHEGMATGTLVTAGTFGVTAAANIGVAGKAFKFAGVTLTGTGILYHRYRMEAADAVKFKNQTISISMQVYHDVGSAIDYTIFVRKANAADNFGAVTAISDSSAQSIETVTASDLNYLAVAMGDCSNGIEIEIKIEAGAITTKNFELTEFQFELGLINANFEYQDAGQQLTACQRRYRKSYNQGAVPGTATATGSIKFQITNVANADHVLELSPRFPVVMASAPSITLYDLAGNSGQVTMDAGNVAGTASEIGDSGFKCQGTNGAVAVDRSMFFHFVAENEL
ncbi:hypothetical protein KAR91_55370 [Candidatus Pacearchaeota archaeon]|nr:hypothetical protein [Candidatus Pacearchaeota archaeon]